MIGDPIDTTRSATNHDPQEARLQPLRPRPSPGARFALNRRRSRNRSIHCGEDPFAERCNPICLAGAPPRFIVLPKLLPRNHRRFREAHASSNRITNWKKVRVMRDQRLKRLRIPPFRDEPAGGIPFDPRLNNGHPIRNASSLRPGPARQFERTLFRTEKIRKDLTFKHLLSYTVLSVPLIFRDGMRSLLFGAQRLWELRRVQRIMPESVCKGIAATGDTCVACKILAVPIEVGEVWTVPRRSKEKSPRGNSHYSIGPVHPAE